MRFWLWAALALGNAAAFGWPSAPKQLSTNWIVSQITGPKAAKSVESLLERFDPKSLQRHLLAYASQSRQSAARAFGPAYFS